MSRLETANSVEQLDGFVHSENNVIVMFSAPWCAPCKAIKPVVEKYSTENTNIKFIYINTEEFSDPEQKYVNYVKSFPSFFCYQKGFIKTIIAGANQSRLNETISSFQKNN